MFTTIGCIVVTGPGRVEESAAAERALERKLAGKPVLEWSIRRASDAQRLHSVVVVCRNDRFGRHVEELLPSDVTVVLSSARDEIGQLFDCLQQHPHDALVRLQADAPLVDPALIDRLISAMESDPDVDYVTFCSRSGSPVVHARLGLVAEIFRASAIRKIYQSTNCGAGSSSVADFVCGHTERFGVKLLPLPVALDRDDVRLTLRSQDDWDHAEEIVDALGTDRLDWQGIAELLETHPALRQRMAVLNRDDG